jgi:hypothetical protein
VSKYTSLNNFRLQRRPENGYQPPMRRFLLSPSLVELGRGRQSEANGGGRQEEPLQSVHVWTLRGAAGGDGAWTEVARMPPKCTSSSPVRWCFCFGAAGRRGAQRTGPPRRKRRWLLNEALQRRGGGALRCLHRELTRSIYGSQWRGASFWGDALRHPLEGIFVMQECRHFELG